MYGFLLLKVKNHSKVLGGYLLFYHSLFVPIRNGIMTQPRCLFVGQAIQMPHRYGGGKPFLQLVHFVSDTAAKISFVCAAHKQIHVCLDTAQATYLVEGSLAQPDHAANGVTDIPVARRQPFPCG